MKAQCEQSDFLSINPTDRILLFLTGSNHMYVFLNPKNVKSAEASLPPEITWEFAQKEIAQAKGFAVGSSGMTKGGNLCMRTLQKQQRATG